MTEQESLTDMVWANAERFGGTIGFRRRVDGSWADVTTREFAAQVLDVAKGMIAAGLRPGDRIALLSGTRYEWSLFDFAGLAIGCQIVPIDATASTAEVEWILADSGACAVVVETAAHRETVRAVVDRLPEIVWVWQLDGGVLDGGEVVPDAVDELTALAGDAGWVSDETVHQRRLAVRADDIATVVYPSGTDRAKRAELTHGELLADVRSAIAAFPALLRPGNSLLILLALADLPARVIAMGCVYTRTTLGHLPEAGDLFTDLGVFRPRVIVADTGLLREVYGAARDKAHADGGTFLFDAAESVARSYGAGSASLTLRLKHAVAGRVVYPKLRAAFGGRCVAAITAGKPLDADRANFFRGIGVDVHELGLQPA